MISEQGEQRFPSIEIIDYNQRGARRLANVMLRDPIYTYYQISAAYCVVV